MAGAMTEWTGGSARAGERWRMVQQTFELFCQRTLAQHGMQSKTDLGGSETTFQQCSRVTIDLYDVLVADI
jgi:hypothetical protein